MIIIIMIIMMFAAYCEKPADGEKWRITDHRGPQTRTPDKPAAVYKNMWRLEFNYKVVSQPSQVA